MHAALKPYVTTGIALVGASAIAIAPIAPINSLPDLSIPTPPALASAAVELAAFPQDLIDLVDGLVQALGVDAVIDLIGNFDPADLTDLVAVVQGGLLNLAPVVYTLLNGLTNLVHTLLTDLVPVLETVFDGLVNVVNALTNNQGLQGVLLGLGAGLGIVVNAIFGGLNDSPIGDAIAAAIGGLFGLLGGLNPLAAQSTVADSPVDLLAAPDGARAMSLKLAAAAQDPVADPGVGDPAASQADTGPSENASPVAGAATATDPTEQPAAVLTEVQGDLQEKGVVAPGITTAIDNATGDEEGTDPGTGGGGDESDAPGNSQSQGVGGGQSGTAASETGKAASAAKSDNGKGAAQRRNAA